VYWAHRPQTSAVLNKAPRADPELCVLVDDYAAIVRTFFSVISPISLRSLNTCFPAGPGIGGCRLLGRRRMIGGK
jgi:hypothetical protein